MILRFHSAAVTSCGHLFTWGHGRSGRLGHGNEEVCMLPTKVEGLASQRVRDVAASETHTAALTAEGELYTWGRDRFGQVNCVKVFFRSVAHAWGTKSCSYYCCCTRICN